MLVRTATNHSMKTSQFIVKHILTDVERSYVNEQVFDVAFDLPRSRFELNHYSGRLFIVSMFNLHDNWINWADV